MGTKDILELLGGFALFLYGKQMMSNGLETAAGNKLRQIPEKLTDNRFLGVTIGAIITVMIQSSFATVVMAAGFVSSGIMSLQQAVWIIMGANIGTTVTGQMIALEIGVIAPLFAFVGVLFITIWKKCKYAYVGETLAGIGVFFIGIDMMEKAMLSLKEFQFLSNVMVICSNPILGILVGIIFTLMIHSSAASVGILQALVVSELIGMEGAVFILFGQNIGTSITAMMATDEMERDARRVTLIHLLFNIIGTILFTFLSIITPFLLLIENLTPANPAAQVANIHTLFNMVTVLLLLPIGKQLIHISERFFLRQKEVNDPIPEKHLEYLSFHEKLQGGVIGSSAIYFNQLHQEILRMLEMVQDNVDKAFWAFRMADEERFMEISKKEEYINYLNQEISQYISRTIINESNERDTQMASQYFQMTGNVERIGDHALKIATYIETLKIKKISFSREAHKEMEQMEQVLQVTFETLEKVDRKNAKWMMRVAKLEQDIDDMTIQFRKNHFERIKQGVCSEEACIIYSEMLTDFEQIGNHALDIAQEMLEMDMF